jgi:hypothetical protein
MADPKVAKRRLRMKVRATPENGDGTFLAQVSTYELEYDIGWGYTEQILADCFADSITAHPTIPIFYNHGWMAGPMGSGQPTENKADLTVAGRLYLGQGDLVGRVYQAMLDEALEEWSIGFWPEEIAWSKDNPQCDQIVRGDLAEASICIRGANPETGTLELNGRDAWIEGDESARKRELARMRSLFGDLPDLGAPRERADGHTHSHTHDDGTVHEHGHTHSGGNYSHTDGTSVTHAHAHPDDGDADQGEGEDPGPDEESRGRIAVAMGTAWGRELVGMSRGGAA